MIGGLIAGALSGGGQAVQQNAQSQIEMNRQKALEKIRQDFQVSEREAGQEFQVSRDETQQGYTQENAELQHNMAMEQERYRQSQQNARSNQQTPQWSVLPDGEGGFVQYDPVTNTTRPAPEGVDFGGGGEISPRQEMVIQDLQSRREIISDQLGGEMLDPEVQQELRRELDTVNAQINRYLNPGSESSDLDAELDATLDSNTEEPTPDNDSPTPPPTPGGNNSPRQPEPESTSFGGLVNNAIASQQEESQQRQTEQRQDEIEQEINQIRSLASKAGRGPITTQDQRNELGREAAKRAERLIASGDLDDRQIERLQEAANNVVQYTDIELD